jgi:hypothetical protein
VFKVIAGDSRTKNDIGLYTFVCPESEEIFEENVCYFFYKEDGSIDDIR